MIDKYKDDFEKLYQEVIKGGKKLSDVIKDTAIFNKEKMSLWQIANYFQEYKLKRQSTK